ncbi:MAG: DUF1963 domain-containing protein [Moraxella sp.]|nr:DUF1963 domain-containing protein [Moraxella sp.]
MHPTKLHQFFNNNPTFDRSDWHALTRPCIDMALTDSFHVSGSYWGGKPYLPKDFELPKAPQGNEYRFIGQLNFADFADISMPVAMPKSGVLSLFYLEYAPDWQMGDNEPFWQDDGFIRAFYFADTADFVVHDDKDTGTPAKGIIFKLGVDLPCNRYFDVNYPPDMGNFYDAFYDGFDDLPDHIFGYPTNNSLGYDPTPQDGEWLPLISLQSHNELNWCWHDGDHLMVFIEKSALVKGDFSNLKTDAG